ncbi:MAG: dephospho-CoA kinase [Burkholderiales bacterium]
MPYCIGLTGGIGSGKSRAAALFGELGAEVIDTDEISHELTRPDGSAMPGIIAAFGPKVVAANGGLDRAAMRELVFADPGGRARLEGILHPLIGGLARARVAKSVAPYVLLVVPLLLEKGGYRDLVQRVLVIDCEESLQLTRTMQRNNLTENAVRAIMAAQLPRQQRLAAADDIIRNDGDIPRLRKQVEALHQQYLKLSGITANRG